MQGTPFSPIQGLVLRSHLSASFIFSSAWVLRSHQSEELRAQVCHVSPLSPIPRSTAGRDTRLLLQPLDFNCEDTAELSLLVATDWVVRAAAGLCIAAKRMGVPSRLQAIIHSPPPPPPATPRPAALWDSNHLSQLL